MSISKEKYCYVCKAIEVTLLSDTYLQPCNICNRYVCKDHSFGGGTAYCLCPEHSPAGMFWRERSPDGVFTVFRRCCKKCDSNDLHSYQKSNTILIYECLDCEHVWEEELVEVDEKGAVFVRR